MPHDTAAGARLQPVGAGSGARHAITKNIATYLDTPKGALVALPWFGTYTTHGLMATPQTP